LHLRFLVLLAQESMLTKTQVEVEIKHIL